jgi:hypothetical protein
LYQHTLTMKSIQMIMKKINMNVSIVVNYLLTYFLDVGVNL